MQTVPAPVRPTELRTVLINFDFVAMATVNVTDYSDDAWADDSTVAAYRAAAPGLPMGSVETTHGVIRSCTNAPFLFFSGIADRVGHFSDDVATRSYAQDFVAAQLHTTLVSPLRKCCRRCRFLCPASSKRRSTPSPRVCRNSSSANRRA